MMSNRGLILIAALLALSACKDDDRRRRDRDRDEPRQPVGAIDFRSTTGSGVKEEPNDTFAIPKCGAGKLGYVVTRWPSPLPPGGTMRIEFTFAQSDGAIVIDDQDRKSTPGNMALFFQRRGDDWTQEYLDRGYRQWSLPRQKLIPGDHVLEVVLLPANWNYGNAGFDATMREVEDVGFTLAGLGGPSFGHGVCMAAGTARITVTGMSVQ